MSINLDSFGKSPSVGLNGQSSDAHQSAVEILERFYSLFQQDIAQLGNTGASEDEIDRAFEYLADIQWQLVDAPATSVTALKAKSRVVRDICNDVESSVAAALSASLFTDIENLFPETLEPERA